MSINHYTPHDKCAVSYNDLDQAIAMCFALNAEHIHFGKTDVSSTFRILPLNRKCYKWLIMKAVNPLNGKTVYFVKKCLPFGASISCSHFQHFSNVLQHIFEHKTRKPMVLTYYLDDFLFVESTVAKCNELVRVFLSICSEIGVPIADEKTKWSNESCCITFLGMLLDGKRKVISIPEEKIVKTINQLLLMLDKKKATVKEIQSLTGLLNFLTRAIFLGRAFTRRMYSKFSGAVHTLKSYHHVKLDKEFKADCRVWLAFLDNDVNNIYRISRPFADLSKFTTANDIGFSSDAEAGKSLDFGCVFGKSWLFGQWELDFIDYYSPSIEVLELCFMLRIVYMD